MERLKEFLLPSGRASADQAAKCDDIIRSAKSPNEVRQYIRGVLRKLREGRNDLVSEALNVAMVLAYRLALDDSSANERLGSSIKEACCRALHPEFYKALSDEIALIAQSRYRVKYARLSTHLGRILAQLKVAADAVSGLRFTTYGRVKTAYSIFEKLCAYADGRESLKDPSAELENSLFSTLNKFGCNVLMRMSHSGSVVADYSTEEIEWILPDLLAATIQYDGPVRGPDAFVDGANLGATKRRYRWLYRRLIEANGCEVYMEPHWSARWHINRLVFYAYFCPTNKIRLPVEVFIRTTYDYCIGYANYWRYKGISLRGDESDVCDAERERLLVRIKGCASFGDVQRLVLEEAKRGLLLF